jgi:hypothetical protein
LLALHHVNDFIIGTRGFVAWCVLLKMILSYLALQNNLLCNITKYPQQCAGHYLVKLVSEKLVSEP